MILDTKRFEDIEPEDIRSLIENNVLESKRLEYKKQPPSKEDKAGFFKFLREFASLANAVGGYLIIGIEELKDDSGNKTLRLQGLTESDIDKLILRLDQIILNNIEPRIPGFQSRPIDVEDGKKVLIYHIPNSWISPHMITKDGKQEFYSRNNSGKYPMDTQEIRMSFIESETLRERVSSFRSNRLGKIVSGDVHPNLSNSSKLVIHIIALNEFMSHSNLISESSFAPNTKLPFIGEPNLIERGSGYPSYNFEGANWIDMSSDGNEVERYTQLFRNGALESMYSGRTMNVEYELDENNTGKYIIVDRLEYQIHQFILDSVAFFSTLGISCPYMATYALVSVAGKKGVTDYSDYQLHGQFRKPIVSDVLVFPDIVIHDINDEKSWGLKTLLDTFYNTFGFTHSPNFNDEGHWKESC